MSQFDLHENRLATTDEHGHRVYLHPEEIKGVWRSLRQKFYAFLIFIYLALPWIYINGQQIVLLDIPNRKFHLFGETFYGHDGPLLIFILLGIALTLAFITSIWGRVWCGWACPQTVFIDSIYRHIERLVEGKARKRRELDKSAWTTEKVIRKSLKWFLFLLVSLHIVHSFLGYFVGTHKLFWISMGSPLDNLNLFIIMLVLTALTLFNFGWFKEQFCIIACPYGRFQSVLMDEHSQVVAYDSARGEPRRAKDIAKDNEGDCISCNRCVKACPTGIDIRRGTQLECIACTMCIDACDEIMGKLNRPKGLIKYTSEAELEGKKKQIKPRSFIYLGLLFVVITTFSYVVSHRGDFKLQFLRAGGTPFSIVSKSEISNHFKVRAIYKNPLGHEFALKLKDESLKPYVMIIIANGTLEPTKDPKTFDVFFKFSKNILVQGRKEVEVLIENLDDPDHEVKSVKTTLVGPL